jgi:hypothetical protein
MSNEKTNQIVIPLPLNQDRLIGHTNRWVNGFELTKEVIDRLKTKLAKKHYKVTFASVYYEIDVDMMINGDSLPSKTTENMTENTPHQLHMIPEMIEDAIVDANLISNKDISALCFIVPKFDLMEITIKLSGMTSLFDEIMDE